jgi:hypothetical protein
MPVAVVNVVGVIPVRNGDMPAAGTVLVGVPLVDRVPGVLALVDVTVVRAVQVPVVRVVGVVPVRNGDVATALAMGVRVLGVRAVDCGRHGAPPRSSLMRRASA